MAILSSEELREFVESNGDPAGEVVDRLLARTAEQTGNEAAMSISEHQARFFEMITRAMNVQLAVEVGTFTGRSSLAIAKGLTGKGRLICCDVSEEWTAIAKQAWQEAGVAHRVDLRIAPALETLNGLSGDQPIDLAFIDADKPAYVDYYEAIVPRLRVGGIVMVDNVLWSGQIMDESATDDDTVGIRQLNHHVLKDSRTLSTMLPVGDGISMHQKL